jgi:hypothetical protein
MFVVSESDAAAIRTTFEQEGELSAAIDLPRRSPGIIGAARARDFARVTAGWTPPPKVVHLRPRRSLMPTGLLPLCRSSQPDRPLGR